MYISEEQLIITSSHDHEEHKIGGKILFSKIYLF